jgi:hypothetical protein
VIKLLSDRSNSLLTIMWYRLRIGPRDDKSNVGYSQYTKIILKFKELITCRLKK